MRYREANDTTSSTKFVARGHCLNKNTLEAFKTCDKRELLREFGKRVLDDFGSGRAIDDPTAIPAFNVLMYSVSGLRRLCRRDFNSKVSNYVLFDATIFLFRI